MNKLKTFREIAADEERIVAVLEYHGYLVVATARSLYRLYPSDNQLEEMKLVVVEE